MTRFFLCTRKVKLNLLTLTSGTQLICFLLTLLSWQCNQTKSISLGNYIVCRYTCSNNLRSTKTCCPLLWHCVTPKIYLIYPNHGICVALIDNTFLIPAKLSKIQRFLAKIRPGNHTMMIRWLSNMCVLGWLRN